MKMPDVLAPYASMIKWGLIAALSAFLFVSGCNHGENKNEKRLGEVEQNLELCQVANASWADAALVRNDQLDANKAEGDKLLQAGEKAAGRSEKEQRETTKDLQSNQNKLEEAQRDPKCNELLRMNVCPTVPLP